MMLMMLTALPLSSHAVARYPLIGQSAPELLQHLIAGPAGNFRLSDHRGEVVLLGFWTSWCTGCGDYLASLRSLERSYANAGLVVMAVSLDDDHAAAASMIKPFAQDLRSSNDHPSVVGDAFRVDDVPMTVLIDRDGVVRYAHLANDYANQVAMQRELRTLLDE
jgi:peroxiredoxin